MRNQKKTNNKGFSLVELIVVIAIMAVLIGVLAPTVISNIEKSRESKDLSYLDTVYSAIQTAYGDEAGNKAAPDDGNTYKVKTYVKEDATAAKAVDSFTALVSEYLSYELDTPNSDVCSGKDICFSITNDKIRVWYADSDGSATAVTGGKSDKTFEVE